MSTKTDNEAFAAGVVAGGGLFIAASYFLHCKLGLGPWKCQSADPRHRANQGRVGALDDCGCGGRPTRRRRRHQ